MRYNKGNGRFGKRRKTLRARLVAVPVRRMWLVAGPEIFVWRMIR